MSDILLEVNDLRTCFGRGAATVTAVNRVNLRVSAGESVGLVGESGSGKSVTSRSILRLIEPPGRIVEGEVRFAGRDLLRLSERELCRVRGRQLAMVFQEPVNSLDPVLPIGVQMREAIRWHLGVSRSDAHARAERALLAARLPDPGRIMAAYPHELSGGMCQRVAIAMALSCEPSMIIADEPTSALDATVQAQILDLLGELQRELGVAILLISHDLTVISRLCSRTAVMYAGRIVEEGPTDSLLRSARHPYTAALVACTPRPENRGILPAPIEGEPLQSSESWEGACAFAPRCRRSEPGCTLEPPPWVAGAPEHFHRCMVVARDG
jgi:oligopeptide/dipeptide ABC transporter ATP-binding protein